MPRPALHRFAPRLVEALREYDRHSFLADLGAGLTVGIVALPLAMAFAIASGVKPEQGLVTAIVAGFVISALGGSSVQIGGPAGAFVVIVYGIVQRYGVGNLLVASVLAGALLLALGWLRLGTLVRYIPLSIVVGFTNGIAVLIALSQLKDLLGLRIARMPGDFFGQIHALGGHLGTFTPAALGLGAACLGGLFVWARLFAPQRLPGGDGLRPRAMRALGRVPGPIVALVSLSVLAAWAKLPVETIESRFGGIPRALLAVTLPELSWAGVQQLFIPTITLAMLGAIESLLCARVADALADTKRHDPNQELMAQGIANMVAPLFGGIPATGTIARTVTNVRAGARTPVAGIVHALTLLAIVLLAAPLAGAVPLAVLAGILLFVAWNMGEWHEFARLRHRTPEHRVKFLCTFVLTVVLDLTVAVQVGLALACVLFIHRMSTLFRVEPAPAGTLPPGVLVYRLQGALFFGAVGKLQALADAATDEHVRTTALVLDASRLLSVDTTGLDALQQLQRDLARRGARLLLAGLQPQPLEMVRRAGLDALLGDAGLHADVAAALQAAGH